jgi:hypothetical protein
VALVSEIVHRELEQAPPRVRGVFAALPPDRVLPVAVDDDVDRLARAYVTSGVVTERSWNDAQHVAAASCARADAVISWNFRDLVASDRMRRFGAINLARGYGPVVILAPHGIRHALEELT